MSDSPLRHDTPRLARARAILHRAIANTPGVSIDHITDDPKSQRVVYLLMCAMRDGFVEVTCWLDYPEIDRARYDDALFNVTWEVVEFFTATYAEQLAFENGEADKSEKKKN